MATGWLLLSQRQTFESKMALNQLSEVEEIACLGSALSFEETLKRDRDKPEPGAGSICSFLRPVFCVELHLSWTLWAKELCVLRDSPGVTATSHVLHMQFKTLERARHNQHFIHLR